MNAVHQSDDDGRQPIPAHQMIALWDRNERRQVTRIAIVPIDQQTEGTDEMPSSAGACTAGWMRGDPIDTPMGLFTLISSLYGFESRDAAVLALREFRKVEGQAEWVDALLRRFGHTLS